MSIVDSIARLAELGDECRGPLVSISVCTGDDICLTEIDLDDLVGMDTPDDAIMGWVNVFRWDR